MGRISFAEQINIILAKSDAEFLFDAYQLILRREPDATGLAYYQSKLQAGVSKAEILNQLGNSREAQQFGMRLQGIGTRARKARFARTPVIGALAPQAWNSPSPGKPDEDAASAMASASQPHPFNVELAEIHELVDELRSVLEGLAHAVEGLRGTNTRHEQALTGMAADIVALQIPGQVDLGDLLATFQSEVSAKLAPLEGLAHAVEGLRGTNTRHEQALTGMAADIVALQIPGQVDLGNLLATLQSEVSAKLASDREELVTRLEDFRSALTLELKGETGAIKGELTAFNEGAVSALENTMADAFRNNDHFIRTIGMKTDALDQKSHWLSVDNDNIRKRIEFIRKEVMFEVQRVEARGGTWQTSSDRAIPVSLVDDQGEPLPPFQFLDGQPRRANLGCGHIAMAGFANVDARPLPGVDIVADLRQLPFVEKSIDELRATHVIEHFTERALLAEVLPHWLSVLRKGGTLTVTAPNANTMMRAYVEGRASWATTKYVLMGGQEYEGDFHFALLDPDQVCVMMKKAGFSAARVEATSRPNGDCLEFEVVATR